MTPRLAPGCARRDAVPRVRHLGGAQLRRRDHLFTIRVDDCQATYDLLRSRGGELLTPPLSHGSETRCFLRDPDGHLFELSEYRSDG